jgi:hypothetical protein
LGRAAGAERALRALLPAATNIPHVNQLKTFNYDYINNSISRRFMQSWLLANLAN